MPPAPLAAELPAELLTEVALLCWTSTLVSLPSGSSSAANGVPSGWGAAVARSAAGWNRGSWSSGARAMDTVTSNPSPPSAPSTANARPWPKNDSGRPASSAVMAATVPSPCPTTVAIAVPTNSWPVSPYAVDSPPVSRSRRYDGRTSPCSALSGMAVGRATGRLPRRTARWGPSSAIPRRAPSPAPGPPPSPSSSMTGGGTNGCFPRRTARAVAALPSVCCMPRKPCGPPPRTPGPAGRAGRGARTVSSDASRALELALLPTPSFPDRCCLRTAST